MIDQPFIYMIKSDVDSPFYDALFAAEIVSMPDLSSYEQFENVDEIECLRRVINVQRLLLMQLNVQLDPTHGLRAFDLRYIWDGKALTLASIVKGACRMYQGAQIVALALWKDLLKQFAYDFYRGGLKPAVTSTAFHTLYAPLAVREAQIVAL